MRDYIGFVYMQTNLINGKKYIGLHIGKIEDNYLGSGVVFMKSISKYGRENFKRDILHFEFDSVENLFRKEFELINFHNAVLSPEFYNLTNYDPKFSNITEGKGIRVVSEETRRKLSEINKGKVLSDKHKARMKSGSTIKGTHYFNNGEIEGRFLEAPLGWVKGRLSSNRPSTKGRSWYNNGKDQGLYFLEDIPEGWVPGVLETTKRYGSQNSFFGKKHTEDSKRKISEHIIPKQGEHNSFYGKKHTEETKLKMRKSRRNK